MESNKTIVKNEMNENRMKILSDRPGSSNVWFIVLLVPNREGLFGEQFVPCMTKIFHSTFDNSKYCRKI